MMPTREALLRTLVVIGAALLLWALRSVIGPLLLAYLFTLVLIPTYNRFAARIGRPLGAAATVLTMVLVPLLVAGVVFFSAKSLGLYFDGSRIDELADAIEAQVDKIYESLPDSMKETIDGELEGGGLLDKPQNEPADVPEGQDPAVTGSEPLSQEEASAAARKKWEAELIAKAIYDVGPQALSAVIAFFGGMFGLLSIAVLIPVFVFFLLLGVPWVPRLRAEIPPDWHPQFDRIVPRIQDILRLYMSSRLAVAFWKGLIGGIALLLLGFPGSFALGVLIGVFSLIPVLGPIIALIPLGLVAFVDGGYTGGHIFGVVVAGSIYGLLELFEGYVLLPRIVGRKLAMSDFAVILAAMCGGALMGIFGLVIAIPALAISKVLYDEFVRPILKTTRSGDDLMPALAESESAEASDR